MSGAASTALHYSYSKPTSDFTFVAATPTRGVFQTDGWGWNRVGFGYAPSRTSGATGITPPTRASSCIDYDDWRHILKTDNRPSAVRKADTENIHIQTFGAHSLHAFTTSAGTFDAWLGARSKPAAGEHKPSWPMLSISRADISRSLAPKLKPWMRGGFTMGSGDGNPNDNRHGTFFQLLPTPRPYARFPFFNMMNTEDAFRSARSCARTQKSRFRASSIRCA